MEKYFTENWQKIFNLVGSSSYQKILTRNLLIYIGLHCVDRSSWSATTLATLMQNRTIETLMRYSLWLLLAKEHGTWRKSKPRSHTFCHARSFGQKQKLIFTDWYGKIEYVFLNLAFIFMDKNIIRNSRNRIMFTQKWFHSIVYHMHCIFQQRISFVKVKGIVPY